ncbi:MAG: HIT family protein [Pseudomonadota bacterium]|nr:HIT family protein [Pseudomonadota bacterium]
MECPFCALAVERILAENDWIIIFKDQYPLSPGHMLIIPKRHIVSLFEATELEQLALLQGLGFAKTQLEQQYQPAGYNIGINEGTAAGQTVMHLHVHFIPRYQGDCVDPRGGIRWILPAKAIYWD